MKAYEKRLNILYEEYSRKVFIEAKRAHKEIDLILEKHNMTIVCGMGTWVLSIKGGHTYYIEDMENPPKDLIEVVAVLDICLEGMRDHCFGSIM